VASLTAGTPAVAATVPDSSRTICSAGQTGGGNDCLFDGGEPVQPEDRDHAVAGQPCGHAADRVQRGRRGPWLVGRARLRYMRKVRRLPDIAKVEIGEVLAGADDVERLGEAGRGRCELARAVESGERHLGQTDQPAGGPRGRQPFQGEPEDDRVELHQLGERAPGRFVGEDFRHQIHPEPGGGVPRLGDQRKLGHPGTGERAERFTAGATRLRVAVVRPLGVLGQDREVQGALAGEVRVDPATGELGPLGDVVDLGVAEALLGELRSSRGQYAGTVALLRLCPAEPRHRSPHGSCGRFRQYDTVAIQMI
jgi:hypothetical protein